MNIYPEKSQQAGRKHSGFLSALFGKLSARGKKNIIKEDGQDEALALVEELKNARNEWIDANMSFEYANSQEMVDYYTYRIKASEVRYEYFLKKAKEKGIKVAHLEKECITPGVNSKD
ncbi:MAG TPA: DUF2508 family protein [Clostridiaceae bacterium]|nr:DUF2508 family protein [Clostridiaceae bacterium]